MLYVRRGLNTHWTVMNKLDDVTSAIFLRILYTSWRRSADADVALGAPHFAAICCQMNRMERCILTT